MSNDNESTWVLLEGLGKDRYEIERFHNYKEAYHFSRGYARSIEDHDEDSGLELVEVLCSYPEQKKYTEFMFGLPMEAVTPSQQDVIHRIEGNLNTVFTGETKDDARGFIGKHLDKSKSVAKARRDYEDECNATTSDLF